MITFFNKKSQAEHEKFLTLEELEAKARAAGFGNLTAQAPESPIHKTTNAFLKSVGKPPILAAPPRKQVATSGKPLPPSRPPATQAAPVAPTGLVTAAEFGTKPLTMLRSEFDTMSPADRSRFCRENGKLVDPVEVKPMHKNGHLTRTGFSALSPAEKSAHCKAGKPIVD